ncbi:hypothetical protein FM113_00920 [Leucobacter sp. 7(1)]|uniref:hypothetical protein n=1 Tax=Leucobacter sp. 7(1) TaxID=1255613 RepID=UPI00097EE059|nr:hypothetical protein [Leucobacter sp. 7(1)]SJN08106.1 hypothetical protein FM113_00920 [Leucobacter sp. 7(1)]
MSSTIHPLRAERTELRRIKWAGIVAALGIAIWAVCNAVIRGMSATVTFPMRVSVEVPQPIGGRGDLVGHGGTLTTQLATSDLPGSAVVWLRLGEILPLFAVALAVALVTWLAQRAITHGLFDRGAIRRLQLAYTLAFALVLGARVPLSVGSRIGLDAFGLEATHWPAGSEFPLTLAILLLLGLGWCEAMLRAGQRIARDQVGTV